MSCVVCMFVFFVSFVLVGGFLFFFENLFFCFCWCVMVFCWLFVNVWDWFCEILSVIFYEK